MRAALLAGIPAILLRVDSALYSIEVRHEASMAARYSGYLSKDNWYGDPLSTRGTRETLIRSIAIQVTATVAFGHLMSLRNLTRKRSVILLLYATGSILFPTLAIAQLLRHVGFAATVAFSQRAVNKNWRYYVCICLGVHGTAAQDGNRTEAISQYPPSRLRSSRSRYNILWCGRILVLLVLLVQFCGTMVLWLRRAYIYQGYYRLWALDNRNLEVVIGGTLVVFISAGILTINTNWEILDDQSSSTSLASSTQIQRSHQVSNSYAASATPAAGLEPLIVVESETLAIDPPTQLLPLSFSISRRQTPDSRFANPLFFRRMVFYLASQSKSLSSQLWAAYSAFRIFNASLSQWLHRFYPSNLQWDIELAYLLHMTFYMFIAMGGNTTSNLGYGWQNLRSLKALFAYSVASRYHHSTKVYWADTKEADVVLAFYFLPCFMLALHAGMWVLVQSPLSRYIPKWCKVFCAELDFWFRSGRTLLSILLSSIMLFTVYFQIQVIRANIEGLRLFEIWAARNPQYVLQPTTMETYRLWTDPWTNYMYII